MNKLTNFRKFVFASIITLFGVISSVNAQSSSSLTTGSGTSDDPYVIASATDWDLLAGDVNSGYNYDGKFLMLDGNITIAINNTVNSNKIVGIWKSDSDYKSFSGTFDGGGHTITFNVGDNTTYYTPDFLTPSAPFGVIKGATIKNLTVTGTIRSTMKYNSGLVGFSFGTQSNIIRCTSNITINCKLGGNTPDFSSAGFLAENKNGGRIRFLNCVFNGEIKHVDDLSNPVAAEKCAGFVSFNNVANTVVIDTCTMAGTINELLSNKATFCRGKSATIRESYFITNYGGASPQGTQAPTTEPTTDIAKKYTVSANTYYVPGAVFTGIETYISTGTELTPTVSYYGRTLTRGTDYVIKIDGEELESGNPTFNAAGNYELSIEGKTDSNYAGAHTVTINVIEINSWADLKTAMSASRGIFTLTKDINADVSLATNTALVVSEGSTIVLNLDGHTINRGLVHVNEEDEVVDDYEPDYNGLGQVIYIESGATLTINGGDDDGGKITGGYHKGAEDNIDGGGIYNLGSLTLNNVKVVGNKCIKKDGNIYSGRGGGIYSGSSESSKSSLVINGGQVSNNDARGGGGGVFVDNASVFDITNVTIADNVSEDKGGGLRLAPPNNTTYNVVGCEISYNSVTDKSQSHGGGIYLDGYGNNSTLNLDRCNLEGNTAFLKGGALYSKRGKTIATNCTMIMDMSFDQLSAAGDGTSYGGAVYLHSGSGETSAFTMDGGSIMWCRTETMGGAVYVEEGVTFNVQGNVQIKECYYYTDENPDADNNVYLAGDNVIHVTGPLDPESEIFITKTDGGSIIDGNSEYWSLSNFTFDDDSYRVKIGEDGKVELYRPYSWTDDPEDWDGYIVKEGENYTIKAAITIPNGCIATPTSITFGSDPNTTGGEIIIEDGGQLVYGTSIPVTVKKNISKATTDDNGWYTISSAVHDHNQTYVSISNIKIIIDNTLNDMYLYDEAESYWRNRKTSGSGFNKMERGRGYLYRNGENVTISYVGKTNVGTLNDYTLSCQANNDLRGFNLVGNPYAHSIAKGSGKAIENTYLAIGYYVLTNAGEWMTCTDGSEIKVNQGILVQATDAGNNQKLVFNDIRYTAPSKDGNEVDKGIEFKVENSDYSDEAYAMFEEAVGLNKISHPNEDIPMLYIRKGEKDYAIATMSDNVKSINLNFEAKTFGRYTLSVKPQGDYRYLHLIDRLAEKDIDLLVESEYSFIGSPADNANRFIVRLEHSDSVDDEVFAYQSENDIVVAGEGELQVFDVMGRLVMRQNVNGVQTVNGLSKGVYIMRLNDMTQKIVIR